MANAIADMNFRPGVNIDGDLATIVSNFGDRVGEKRRNAIELGFGIERRELDLRFLAAIHGSDLCNQIECVLDLFGDTGFSRRYSRLGM